MNAKNQRKKSPQVLSVLILVMLPISVRGCRSSCPLPVVPVKAKARLICTSTTTRPQKQGILQVIRQTKAVHGAQDERRCGTTECRGLSMRGTAQCLKL